MVSVVPALIVAVISVRIFATLPIPVVAKQASLNIAAVLLIVEIVVGVTTVVGGRARVLVFSLKRVVAQVLLMCAVVLLIAKIVAAARMVVEALV